MKERIVRTLPALAGFAALVMMAGCCDEKALPGAMQRLESSQASERNQALHVVGRCGQRAESAVPTIARLMYDKNVGVASSAAYALRKIDTPSARAALQAAEEARRQKKAARLKR